jgi:hypothetical protein
MGRTGGNPAMTGDITEVLHQGYLGNLTTLRTLQLLCGYSIEEAAQATLVSPETFRRWRSDRKPNPAAVRLLAILAGYVPWHGWDGWEVHNKLLFPPGYSRYGLAPGEILALPYLHQALAAYRQRERDEASESVPVQQVKT